MIDEHFRVEVLSKSPNPQQVIYAAMHQDYCEQFAYDNLCWGGSHVDGHYCQQPHKDSIFEEEAGLIVLKNLLAGQRGHYGPLEHPQIVLNVGWFPHSVMQQIRTHRVGVSFDVQSFRYTGARIKNLGELCSSALSSFASLEDAMPILQTDIEQVFYLRPMGFYADRQGKKYEYTEDRRREDLAICGEASIHYANRISQGFAEEQARSLVPFDIRQHWVLSANVRSVMHLLDLRAKADAQLECQQLCDLIWPHFECWVPEIAGWYKQNRWGKAKLAP